MSSLPITGTTPRLPDPTGVTHVTSSGERLLVSRSEQPPSADHSFRVSSFYVHDTLGLQLQWQPPWTRWEGDEWKLSAGLSSSVQSHLKNQNINGAAFLDLGLDQDLLRFGGITFLDSVRLMPGISYSTATSQWTPVAQIRAALASIGPRDSHWSFSIGAMAQYAEGGFSGGPSIGFNWGTREKAKSTDYPDSLAVKFSDYFEDLDFSELKEMDLSGMDGFLDESGDPIESLQSGDQIRHFKEFTSYRNPDRKDALTLVIDLPELTDASGKDVDRQTLLENIKRSLLFIFLEGDEETNPYYNRFHQFRFLVAKSSIKSVIPAQEDLFCSQVPGLERQGDAIAQFLHDPARGFKYVNAIHGLAGCRSQAAPIDFSTAAKVVEIVTDMIGKVQTAKDQDVEQIIRTALESVMVLEKEGENITRFVEPFKKALAQKSIDPILDEALIYHWAPRVYLDSSDAGEYAVLRHELGHTLNIWKKNNEVQHAYQNDGYVEDGNPLTEVVRGYVNKGDQPLLTGVKEALARPETQKLFKKPSPLFPTLYVGSAPGEPPEREEVMQTLGDSGLTEMVMEGLEEGTLDWIQQGFYVEDSGIWQLKMKVSKSGHPDSTGEFKLGYMTDSHSGDAPYDPVGFELIQRILDEHLKEYER